MVYILEQDGWDVSGQPIMWRQRSGGTLHLTQAPWADHHIILPVSIIGMPEI